MPNPGLWGLGERPGSTTLGVRVGRREDFPYHGMTFPLGVFPMSIETVLDQKKSVQDRAEALGKLWKQEGVGLSGLARVEYLTDLVRKICASTLGESSAGKDVLFGILEGLCTDNVKTVVYRAIRDHLDEFHPQAIASRKNNTPGRWKNALSNWSPQNTPGFDWAFWNTLGMEEDTLRGERGMVAFVEKNHTQKGWPAGGSSPFLPFGQMFEETGSGTLTGATHQFGQTCQRCDHRFRELMAMMGWENEVLVENLVVDQIHQTPERAIEGYEQMKGLSVEGGDDALRAQVWLWTVAHLAPFSFHRWQPVFEHLDEVLPLTRAVHHIIVERLDNEPGFPTNRLESRMEPAQVEVWMAFRDSAMVRHQLETSLPAREDALGVSTPPVRRL